VNNGSLDLHIDEHAATLLSLGVIGVVVGRRLLGFPLRIDRYTRCPLPLGLDLASAVLYGCVAVNLFRTIFRRLLALRFLPDDESHRCHQFVVPVRHLGFVIRGGTNKTLTSILITE